MNSTGKVAAAIAAGYLLGRTKKLKLAITVGGLLAGKRIATDPRELVQQALGVIENNPELAKLSDQVRGRLVDAGKEAAVAAASSQLNRVSDSIRTRTDRMKGVPGMADVAGRSEDGHVEDSEGGEPADSGEERREERHSRLRRLRPHRRRTERGDGGSVRTDREFDSSERGGRPTRKTARKRPAASSAERPADSGRTAKKTASKRSESGSTAKKTAAKKATAKKSTPPRKTTAKKSTAKKTAKKATSGSSARKRG
jgi:hypothetical protein